LLIRLTQTQEKCFQSFRIICFFFFWEAAVELQKSAVIFTKAKVVGINDRLFWKKEEK
jgi:hypothetical protein